MTNNLTAADTIVVDLQQLYQSLPAVPIFGSARFSDRFSTGSATFTLGQASFGGYSANFEVNDATGFYLSTPGYVPTASPELFDLRAFVYFPAGSDVGTSVTLDASGDGLSPGPEPSTWSLLALAVVVLGLTTQKLKRS